MKEAPFKQPGPLLEQRRKRVSYASVAVRSVVLAGLVVLARGYIIPLLGEYGASQVQRTRPTLKDPELVWDNVGSKATLLPFA